MRTTRLLPSPSKYIPRTPKQRAALLRLIEGEGMDWKKFACAGVLSLALGLSGAAMAQDTNKDVKDQKTAQKEHDKAAKEQAKDVNKKPKDTNRDEKGLDRDRKAAENKVEHADTSFMKKVAEHTKAELELAQLAEQKAADPQVKEFAEKI